MDKRSIVIQEPALIDEAEKIFKAFYEYKSKDGIYVYILGNLEIKEIKIPDEIKEDAKTEINIPAPVQTAQTETAVAEEPVKTEAPLPYTPGYVTLDGVKEQDAAVIMAITSHESGIPLERLCFKSIRRLNQEPELINI